MFFSCLQQISLQEKSSFITSGKWNLPFSSPYSYCHFNTWRSNTLCCSCFSFHLAGALPVNSNRQNCLNLGVSGRGSVSLISSISFLGCFTSPCVVFIFICVLCHSHHSIIPSQGPLKGIEAFCVFWCREGVDMMVLLLFEALPFWFSNAVITDNFGIFLLLLEGQSVTIPVSQVILEDT